MAAHRKTWMVIITVVVVLGGVRLALPWMVKDYVNRTFQEMEDYSGRVEDIDIAFLRGAYRIKGLNIEKQTAEKLEPFFSAPMIDLAVQWRRLIRGTVVAEIIFREPRINLVESKEKDRSQTGAEVDWRRKFESLFPFNLDRVLIQDGEIRFRTSDIKSQDAITVRHVAGDIRNLTNAAQSREDAFTTFDFEGEVFDAPLQVAGRLNPVAAMPTFDVNARLEQVPVPELNPWLRKYVNVDAQAGVFALYVELAAANGYFYGYAKPFSEGIEIFDMSDDSKGLLQKAWEAIVDVTAKVLENSEEEDVGTRIPIRGTIDNPEAGVWQAIINALRHAFLGSFSQSLEHSVSLDNGKIEVGPKAEEDKK